jgi:trehalose/maltose hydrolase-like predicted phosphorylase
MYPSMLLMNQDIARSMIDYRADRIEPARRKAADYGFDGLMFPWESDSDGQEATPVWALTGPMEHHVTADVGIAAWNYYCVTKDVDWLKKDGWKLLNGVAEFWVSRVKENADASYSIEGVVGADEYAENVRDNAFTNAAAKVALENAVKAAEVCGYPAPAVWKKIADGLKFNYDSAGVTLEYEGYSGQMIKQADVNLLAYPLGVVSDPEQIRRDLEYYEKKIDMVNGPAMTFSVFAIQYARLGDRKRASEMFRRAYEINLRPPFGVFAETPTSNNPYFMTGAGGMLQAVLFGFCGLDVTEEGIVQNDPMLPLGWSRLIVKGVGPEKKTFIVE